MDRRRSRRERYPAAVLREFPPREALEHAIKTAEVLDGIVAELGPAEAEAVAAQRYRVLDRSLHRCQHLDEVDRALGVQAAGTGERGA